MRACSALASNSVKNLSSLPNSLWSENIPPPFYPTGGEEHAKKRGWPQMSPNRDNWDQLEKGPGGPETRPRQAAYERQTRVLATGFLPRAVVARGSRLRVMGRPPTAIRQGWRDGTPPLTRRRDALATFSPLL